MNNYTDEEFENIIRPILEVEEFNRLKYITHHGITRYDHSMRVAYLSYKVSKSLRLNYQEVTEAALLHDFFLDEVDQESRINRLRMHPECAVKNASKYFDLTDRQVDIIRTHMFPVTFAPPKYLESGLWTLWMILRHYMKKDIVCIDNFVRLCFLFMFVVVNFVKMR